MKIVVPVKHVADPDATWRYQDDLTVDRAALEGRLSELDEYAVEQAVSLVEKGLEASVTFLTMGPAAAVDGLRKALAMGGDDAVHVLDDALARIGRAVDVAGPGPRGRADRLRSRPVRHVVDGRARCRWCPAMLADRLGVPQVTFAERARRRPGRARHGHAGPATRASTT